VIAGLGWLFAWGALAQESPSDAPPDEAPPSENPAPPSDAPPVDAPPAEEDPDAALDAAERCNLQVLREVDADVRTVLPAGMFGCDVTLMVDERGRVASVTSEACPAEVLAETTPQLSRWRFDRSSCETTDPVRFDLRLQSDKRTYLVPPGEPVAAEAIASRGPETCVLAMTLLPDGRVEAVRASDPDRCSVRPGIAGFNPERYWRSEIEGLRCKATFEVYNGLANRVKFEGCGGPSRMALVSFVEQARWGEDVAPGTAFDVRFSMRNDESPSADLAAEQVRLIRQGCERAEAPRLLVDPTRIPPMPARWALDRSQLAAYCRMRVHLDEQAVPRRIDAVLCGDVYAPRAASAIATWNYEAPLCDGVPVKSEVVILVPFAERMWGGAIEALVGGTPVVDLAAELMYVPDRSEDCRLTVDLPTDGQLRVTTNDKRECFVTPTAAYELRRSEIMERAEILDRWVIECNVSFDAVPTGATNVRTEGCMGRSRELSLKAVEEWSWSVLGRETEHYEVRFRYRLN
jgi:hypothetical protein